MAILVKKNNRTEEDSFMANAIRIAELAAGIKAKDISAFDLRGLTLVADAFVIASATSEPQMKAVVNAIKDGMREIGVSPLRTEGTHTAGWLLIDYGSIIVHVFREEAREFYNLDDMWADAKPIPLDLDA